MFTVFSALSITVFLFSSHIFAQPTNDELMQCLPASPSVFAGDKANIGSRKPAFFMFMNEPKASLGESSLSGVFETLIRKIEEAGRRQTDPGHQSYLQNVVRLLRLDIQGAQTQADHDAKQLREQRCRHNSFGADYAIIRNQSSELFYDGELANNRLSVKLEVCHSKDNAAFGNPQFSMHEIEQLMPPVKNSANVVTAVTDPFLYLSKNFTPFNAYQFLQSAFPIALPPLFSKGLQKLKALFPIDEYYYVLYFKGVGDRDRLFGADYAIDSAKIDVAKLEALLLNNKFAEVNDDLSLLEKVAPLARSMPIRETALRVKMLISEGYPTLSAILPADPKAIAPDVATLPGLPKGEVVRALSSEFSSFDKDKSARVPLVVLDSPFSDLSLTRDVDLAGLVTSQDYAGLNMDFIGKVCVRKGVAKQYETIPLRNLFSPPGVNPKKTTFFEHLESIVTK
jgi:hypothetical protein